MRQRPLQTCTDGRAYLLDGPAEDCHVASRCSDLLLAMTVELICVSRSGSTQNPDEQPFNRTIPDYIPVIEQALRLRLRLTAKRVAKKHRLQWQPMRLSERLPYCASNCGASNTRRNPMSPRPLSRLQVTRLDTRQSPALLNQLPPRSTRREPEVGPLGFVDGELL